jgi:hypothetical protein
MITSILEANPKIEQWVWDDLAADKKSGHKKPTGAHRHDGRQDLYAFIPLIRANCGTASECSEDDWGQVSKYKVS